MWFLWIVITAIVILFNFTQLLGLIVAKVKGRRSIIFGQVSRFTPA